MSITRKELLDRVSDRVEVKSVDVASNLSEETLAYTATVYMDGKIIGAARNRGRGGMSVLEGFHDGRSGEVKRNIGKLREFADTLPEVETRFGTMEYGAEQIIDLLVEVTQANKEAKRHARNGKVVVRTADQGIADFTYADSRGNDTSTVVSALIEHNGLEIDEVFTDGEWTDVESVL